MTLFIERTVKTDLPFGYDFWDCEYITFESASGAILDAFDCGKIDGTDLQRAKVVKLNGQYKIASVNYNLKDLNQ
jgi:hypothetical protein